jgi:hypothetical protein
MLSTVGLKTAVSNHHIRYRMFAIIFADDGSGEVADVVAIQVDDENAKLLFELYHCKFSDGANPGARLGTLC